MRSEIHALSGAYAVDALDDVERVAFERHLAECVECRDEVAGLRETAALVATEAVVPPPPALRDLVLADVARVRPLPPAPAPAGDRRAQRSGGSSSGDPDGRWRRWAPALAAAAVLVAVGAGAAAWQPWADDTPGHSARLTAAEQVLRAPDARSVTLEFPDGASARVTRSVREGRAVITTEDMPPAPTGKVYQLWFQHDDGSMTPAGVMPPRPDQTVLLRGDAADAVGAGITVEPAGGSPEPSGEPIALFEFRGRA